MKKQLSGRKVETKDVFFARDRTAWRAWLKKHHASAKNVWLLFFKKRTGRPCVSLNDAVEEALCFGWIDGKLRRVDDERHMLRFSPRRPNSIWSESNKARVRRLIRNGLMTPAGLSLVQQARRSGQWARAREREKAGPIPSDLARALARNAGAQAFFRSLAPSYRSMYVAWVMDAKREETRGRRIERVLERCAQERKPGIDL